MKRYERCSIGGSFAVSMKYYYFRSFFIYLVRRRASGLFGCSAFWRCKLYVVSRESAAIRFEDSVRRGV